MSRGSGRSFVISALEPLPDLAALAQGNDDLQGWLAAQEFPYESMNGREVVRVLRKRAGIRSACRSSPRVPSFRPSTRPTKDDLVACVFDVEFAPFNRPAKLEMASRHDRRVKTLQRQANARKAAIAALD